MANTFDWVEIRTDEIEETAAFYQALFGWQIIAREKTAGTDVWIFDTGDEPRIQNLRRGGIWLRPKGEQLGVVVYITVDDIQSTLSRVVELGGDVAGPSESTGAGQIAFFRDPCGNLIGLYQDQ